MNELTSNERAVLDCLVDAYNHFAYLPTLHPDDFKDFVYHTHALQNIVMARVAVRSNPEYFHDSSVL